MCARDAGRLKGTGREIESSTEAQVLPVQAGLTKKEDIGFMVEKTLEQFGRADILVNNTGGPPRRFSRRQVNMTGMKLSTYC